MRKMAVCRKMRKEARLNRMLQLKLLKKSAYMNLDWVRRKKLQSRLLILWSTIQTLLLKQSRMLVKKLKSKKVSWELKLQLLRKTLEEKLLKN
uniref:Uncharacterized protein n=1 Tax=Rhizophora mucronata TaxID=61149 RepID=A0A2P2NQ48_RHIMU